MNKERPASDEEIESIRAWAENPKYVTDRVVTIRAVTVRALLARIDQLKEELAATTITANDVHVAFNGGCK